MRLNTKYIPRCETWRVECEVLGSLILSVSSIVTSVARAQVILEVCNVESEACRGEEYNVFVVAYLPRRIARANYPRSNAIRFSIGYAKSIISPYAYSIHITLLYKVLNYIIWSCQWMKLLIS